MSAPVDEAVEPTALDLAAGGDDAVAEAPFSVGICPDNRPDVELLRDLLAVEYARQSDGRNSPLMGALDESTLGNALAMALRRLGTAPSEPWDRAARVTGTRTGEDPVEYAKVAGVWVSPADTTGRSWTDLVVEYDELTVNNPGDVAR